VNIKKTSQKAGYSPDFTIEAEWSGQDFREDERDEEALHRWGTLIKEAERKAFEEVNFLNAREGYPLIGVGDVIHDEYQDNGRTIAVMGMDRAERIDEETGEIYE
jgi:hypothetical protein